MKSNKEIAQKSVTPHVAHELCAINCPEQAGRQTERTPYLAYLNYLIHIYLIPYTTLICPNQVAASSTFALAWPPKFLWKFMLLSRVFYSDNRPDERGFYGINASPTIYSDPLCAGAKLLSFISVRRVQMARALWVSWVLGHRIA